MNVDDFLSRLFAAVKNERPAPRPVVPPLGGLAKYLETFLAEYGKLQQQHQPPREASHPKVEQKHTCEVLDEVLAERGNQDANWGPHHDDQHTPADWVGLIVKQLGEVVSSQDDLRAWRDNMIAAAALAVAAVESADRHIAKRVASSVPHDEYPEDHGGPVS